ncbi:hypothetical protein [Alphaentomopoxvirus acuprea]|uniref:Uncharacterized protein n=1 Tax=Alphaentomopoxvirus acuprea TaxID=62099 RepID=W6JIQ6_9POXV|nr:hypothetical protein BA82_gp077 [Anomala cuprea entomopoxvirus]BAO49437.1 hypothetical protein [Anomala cuprea entomopoxvirus]
MINTYQLLVYFFNNEYLLNEKRLFGNYKTPFLKIDINCIEKNLDNNHLVKNYFKS